MLQAKSNFFNPKLFEGEWDKGEEIIIDSDNDVFSNEVDFQEPIQQKINLIGQKFDSLQQNLTQFRIYAETARRELYANHTNQTPERT